MNINTLKGGSVKKYCMLTRRLLSHLQHLAERSSFMENAGCYAASAFFSGKDYTEVEKKLSRLLESLHGGELISCEISSGKIIDQREEHFLILRGRFFEFYNYEETSACFIRLYLLKELRGEKVWCAMYVDENPRSPWWTEEV